MGTIHVSESLSCSPRALLPKKGEKGVRPGTKLEEPPAKANCLPLSHTVNPGSETAMAMPKCAVRGEPSEAVSEDAYTQDRDAALTRIVLHVQTAGVVDGQHAAQVYRWLHEQQQYCVDICADLQDSRQVMVQSRHPPTLKQKTSHVVPYA